MSNLYESKFMQKVKSIGEKCAGNKAIAAVSAGMMMAMGIILIGAIFQLIAIIPTFFGAWTTDDAIYNILLVPYDLSMGLISVYMAFTIAYSYAKSLKMQALTNALNAMLIFLIVAGPIKTVELADGSSFTGIDNSCLGAVGMFTAIIISLCTVKMAHFCEKHHLMIKMPDVVPKFLQDTFASLIPLVINIAIWHTIGSICLNVMTISLPYAISYLLSAPLGALTSVPGIFNINEPATFGYPIMYNPTLAIPFVINPLITMIICYFGYMVGFFKPAFTMITATLPVGVSPYLCTLSWTNILIPVIAFIVAWVVYRPFFKVYERDLIAKEQEAKEVA